MPTKSPASPRTSSSETSISQTLIVGDDGVTYIDGLAEDLSQPKQDEDALIAMGEDLARSNVELEKLSSTTSDDLRGRHFLDNVVEGETHMIRDTLSKSLVNGAQQTSDIDSRQVVDRVLFNLQSSIIDSQAEVIVESLPHVRGDPVLLGQLFQSRIANGIKFRRVGTVPRIVISARRDGGWWRFSVADNGIGITPKHRDRICEEIQPLPTKDVYDDPGIGLAVCRQVVHWHGGKIFVELNCDGGFTFCFSLPIQAKRNYSTAFQASSHNSTSARMTG